MSENIGKFIASPVRVVDIALPVRNTDIALPIRVTE